MTGLAHRADATQIPSGLEEITERIYSRIDRFALDLGAELDEAFRLRPDIYEQWVVECLPFGLDKARRLRMIHRAFETLPDDVMARMPRPWQAMFAISRLPADVIVDRVADGTIHEGLTVRETNELVADIKHPGGTRRHSEADLVIGRLVGLPPESVSGDALGLLRGWLDRLPRESVGVGRLRSA